MMQVALALFGWGLISLIIWAAATTFLQWYDDMKGD